MTNIADLIETDHSGDSHTLTPEQAQKLKLFFAGEEDHAPVATIVPPWNDVDRKEER